MQKGMPKKTASLLRFISSFGKGDLLMNNDGKIVLKQVNQSFSAQKTPLIPEKP